MVNKIADSVAGALQGVADRATVLIGGFGTADIPDELIEGLLAQVATDLMVVNNNAAVRTLLRSNARRVACCSSTRSMGWARRSWNN